MVKIGGVEGSRPRGGGARHIAIEVIERLEVEIRVRVKKRDDVLRVL